jgi:hypothetical protein
LEEGEYIEIDSEKQQVFKNGDYTKDLNRFMTGGSGWINVVP